MSASTTPESIKAAKKAHGCSWCAERIDAGQPYVRWRYFMDGDAGTCKAHPECHDAMMELSRLEGGFVEFTPGESPRGCNCGYDAGCPCASRRAAPNSGSAK